MDHHHDGFSHDHDLSSHSHISKHGELLGTSTKNIFGGKDYTDSHGILKGYTIKNVHGGHDYHNSHGDLMGHTISGMGHNNFLGPDGNMHHSPGYLHSDHVNSMRMDLLNRIR
jgi:hypothetical protein